MRRRITDRRTRRHRWGPPATVPPVAAGNVWSFPEDLSNAVWQLTGATVTADAAIGPDGLQGADKLKEDASTGPHRVFRTMDQAVTGQPQTTVFYVKKNDRDHLIVRSTSPAGVNHFSTIDLSLGSISHDPEHAVAITNLGNDWWFIRITLAGGSFLGGSGTPRWDYFITTTASGLATSYLGNGGSLYLFNLQYFPNNDGIGLTSQYPVAPPPQQSAPLRLGFWGLKSSEVGIDPAGVQGAAADTLFRAGLCTPTPTNVTTYLALAEQYDVVLVLNLAGGRHDWLVGQPATSFDFAAYQANVDRFKNIPEVAAALASKRAIITLCDEPFKKADYGDPSVVGPIQVNEMGLYHKKLWPGCVCAVRAEHQLFEGWSNVDGASVPPPDYISQVTGQHTGGGYTGVDYGWAQLGEGKIRSAVGGAGSPMNSVVADWYAFIKAGLAGVDLGMIPGLNWWDGGQGHTDEGIDACWDYQLDGTLGVIIGTSDATLTEGQFVPCSQTSLYLVAPPTKVSSPNWIRHAVAVAATDPDAPLFLTWRWSNSSFGAHEAWTSALQSRSDYIQAWADAIVSANARPTWNGWRPIK